MPQQLQILPPKSDVTCLILHGRKRTESKLLKIIISNIYALTTLESLFNLKYVIVVNKMQVTLKQRRRISFPLLCNKLPQQQLKTTNICYPNIQMRCHVDQDSRCGLAGCLRLPPRQQESCQPELRYLKASLGWKSLLNSLVRLLSGFTRAHVLSSLYLSVGAPVTNTTGWHLKRWTFVVSPCQRIGVETRVFKDCFGFVFADGHLTCPYDLSQSSFCAASVFARFILMTSQQFNYLC